MSTAAIARVKDATDLIALVSAYREIKQSKILCVFHEERNPSCRIYESHFHCYTCGAHGDAFAFLMRVEGITFPEALRRLADAAGVSLDERPVSRVAMQYAREEAAMCKWWCGRRRARMMAEIYANIEDEGLCEILEIPLAAWDALTVPEKFSKFRSQATERDRTEYRQWLKEEAVRNKLRDSVKQWRREVGLNFVAYAKKYGFKDPDDFVRKYGGEAFRIMWLDTSAEVPHVERTFERQ